MNPCALTRGRCHVGVRAEATEPARSVGMRINIFLLVAETDRPSLIAGDARCRRMGMVTAAQDAIVTFEMRRALPAENGRGRFHRDSGVPAATWAHSEMRRDHKS